MTANCQKPSSQAFAEYRSEQQPSTFLGRASHNSDNHDGTRCWWGTGSQSEGRSLMATGESKSLRYGFGGALCLMALASAWAGLEWYWAVIVISGGVTIILGKRRIFRPGITRTALGIVCRYIPWYEGNVFFTWLLLPLMAVAMIGAGRSPENPAWLRFGGILLLLLVPLFVSSVTRMWRRSVLRITPSALTVRLAASKGEPTVIRREDVQSIEPKLMPSGVGSKWLEVEISYRTADLTETVLLGPQLSIQPVNLLNALVAWKEAPYADPTELLDAIERILRGREFR